MLPVVTSIHDPAALAETCRRIGLPPPERGSARLGGREVSGWVVCLSGLHPVVCDTLSGLLLYHPADNTHGRFARLAHFIQRYYDVRARLSRPGSGNVRKFRRPALVEVA